MSYRIDITGKKTHILIELFGEIGIQKIFSLDSFLYADYEFINNPFVIWDFTECTIDIEIEQIIDFARLVRKSRNSMSPGKTAFVTHHALQHSEQLSPEIELIDESQSQIKSFSNRVSATKWIEE